MTSEKQIHISGFERPSDAAYMASIIRWSFMRNYKSVRVVGLNVITGNHDKKLEEIATLADSTDIVLDIAVRLSSAAYEVTDKVYKLLEGNIGGASNMDVGGDGSVKIGVIRFVKHFNGSGALTYGDLREYFTFFDGPDTTIIANSMYTGDITFEFYVQWVQRVQDVVTNQLNLNFVFGEDAVKIAIPSTASAGIEIYTRELDGSVNLCIQTHQGDTRVPDLEKRFREKLENAKKLLQEF